MEAFAESETDRQGPRRRFGFDQIGVLGLYREHGELVEHIVDIQEGAPAIVAV